MPMRATSASSFRLARGEPKGSPPPPLNRGGRAADVTNMTPPARRIARVLIACGLAVLPLLGPSPAATATDLRSLRERAQRVADEVSALEHRLESLRARNAELDERIARLSQRIAVLEGAIHAEEAALETAHSAFVERAVEAYKAGPTSELALLLSARDIGGLLDAAEGLSNAADDDLRALRDLVRAVEALERTQGELDGRKQDLLEAEAENEIVAAEMTATLSSRRTALARLNEEVARLEARARARAARAAQPDAALAELLEPAGPAAAVPNGYVGTGITFEGIASWYGPGFEGNPTATGDIFDPDLYTAASRDLPFGTLLFVQHEGAGVVVVINDRGPYIEERILDLSRAAADAIGLGLGWVTAEILVPERR
jgi:rare lipoprotein A (peptidoglycan hydrolase)/cell division protein FtsB